MILTMKSILVLILLSLVSKSFAVPLQEQSNEVTKSDEVKKHIIQVHLPLNPVKDGPLDSPPDNEDNMPWDEDDGSDDPDYQEDPDFEGGSEDDLGDPFDIDFDDALGLEFDLDGDLEDDSEVNDDNDMDLWDEDDDDTINEDEIDENEETTLPVPEDLGDDVIEVGEDEKKLKEEVKNDLKDVTPPEKPNDRVKRTKRSYLMYDIKDNVVSGSI